MALTDIELARIRAIEELLNEVQTAMTNLASKTQLNQYILIRQSEIRDLQTRISDLESQITALQSRLI